MGLEEEAHLELIKVNHGEEERMSARGDPEKNPEERAKGTRRPKSQERFHGRDRISTIEEVRTGKLETTGEAVGIRASNTHGLVTAFTGGYEISRSTIGPRDEDRRYIRHHPRGRNLRESRWKSGH